MVYYLLDYLCKRRLLGMPDLLCKEAGGYVPGDIKSGRGDEEHDGKPKQHYGCCL